MDTNKPQTSDEEGAQPPPLLARSPYRPMSLRRRQAMPAAPQPAVQRPMTGSVFNASPNTIAAVLANTGASPDGLALVWDRRVAAEPAAEADGASGHAPGE
jgi:hypothetical protein